MEWFTWWRRGRVPSKKVGPEEPAKNLDLELVQLIQSQKEVTYEKCQLDSHSLVRVVNIVSQLMSAGKMQSAAEFCKIVAKNCFGARPENPYRLIFLSIAMVAECEVNFYDHSFYRVTATHDLPLKVRYSLCHQSTAGFLEMEPTIFRISDLLTMCEEFAHFACFRQCHVNLFKNIAEIGEDDDVDWFDRARVLETNIAALINDSDLVYRFCEKEKDKIELVRQLKSSSKGSDQMCFSWFNHLHLREICLRSTAAKEILKMDPAFLNFIDSLPRDYKPKPIFKLVKKRKFLVPQNPKAELEAAKRKAQEEKEAAFLKMSETGKPRVRRRLINPAKVYATDVDDFNYSVPLKDGKSLSDMNASKVKDEGYFRRQRERHFNAGGDLPIDPMKRMPPEIRKRMRILLRNMMQEGRKMQEMIVIDDDLLNKAFPVTDDELSDDERPPMPFQRTKTLASIQQKAMRKFGGLNPRSDSKPVFWWDNARDELLVSKAIEMHCRKVDGTSSVPFDEFEEFRGKLDVNEKMRDLRVEVRREADCKTFNLERQLNSNDSSLLAMPTAMNPFKNLKSNRKTLLKDVGLNSLVLQNMRRRCIDELLILFMIIKGQEQLQHGNIVRCIAYMMLIQFKVVVIKENSDSDTPELHSVMNPYLLKLYKCLLSKFRLYSFDIFSWNCLTRTEQALLRPEDEKYDLNERCFKFCQNTKAYFFCICIRGRVIELDVDEIENKQFNKIINRKVIEEQHEFFFGLEDGNRRTHLYEFWNKQCLPIISGFVHITDHNLLRKLESMSQEEGNALIDSTPDLTNDTRYWLKSATKYGFMALNRRPKKLIADSKKRNYVPMLFQLPSKILARMNTDQMVKPRDLDRTYQKTTKFVCDMHENWKKTRHADKGNIGKTNKDYAYWPDEDMTFFGENIEKDIYMVAVYKDEIIEEQKDEVTQGMSVLCREIRSQAGFLQKSSSN